MINIIFAVLPNASGKGGNILKLITEATPVGKAVMLILLIFSIISWAVIIFKLVEYKNARK